MRQVFGKDSLIQRCQVHKARNILEHLPPSHHRPVRMRLRAAWGMKSYEEAKSELVRLVRHLKGLNLDEAKIHELLWRLKSKLVEYERDYYGGLERAIAERFRLARSPWRMPSSEISFFFTLGMCEAQLFDFTPTTKEDPS